ncbi:MAG: ATPase [bacterium]|nr:ATPase [bacterium]
MNSKIEQTIEELEQYIDSCKAQPFSPNKIIVNKDQIDELLTELRLRTPEEIKRYQKMISNKEAILADAQAKADTIIAQAEVTHSELVSEHQIMQQAYAQANEVIVAASKQAQDILDKATMDANSIRLGAISYTDELLGNLETILSNSIDSSKARYDNLISNLSGILQVVVANRNELMPVDDTEEMPQEASSADAKSAQMEEQITAELEQELLKQE